MFLGQIVHFGAKYGFYHQLLRARYLRFNVFEGQPLFNQLFTFDNKSRGSKFFPELRAHAPQTCPMIMPVSLCHNLNSIIISVSIYLLETWVGLPFTFTEILLNQTYSTGKDLSLHECACHINFPVPFLSNQKLLKPIFPEYLVFL